MIYTVTLNPALDREMTVAEIALDRVLRARAVQTDLGGKGFNVSRALLALGEESTALGFIGGAIGEKLLAGLADLGIHTDFVRLAGETRINLSVISADHAHYVKVNEPGPLVTNRESSAMVDKIHSLVKPGDWWVVAGSSPPGISPGYIAELIQIILSGGAFAALDMDGEALLAGCSTQVSLVKPNASEATVLTGLSIGGFNGTTQSLLRIHALGAQRVVISLGRTGAVYSDGKGCWWAEPPAIHEHNPIGAGDAMLAGLVLSLSRNLSAQEVLRWGVACGAAAASLDGTAVGSLPYVQSLLSKVRVGQL